VSIIEGLILANVIVGSFGVGLGAGVLYFALLLDREDRA
jgi:hypothetical protein